MSYSVAYLGPAGTFTEQALRGFVDKQVLDAALIPIPVSSPAEALRAVLDDTARFAVVAIENSVDGAVTSTYDALVDGDVQIFHELEIEIAFSILVKEGTAREEIRTFATHPVAHQQVRTWLATHLPDAEFIPASSNAAAAEMVAQGKADAAAAPARAGELFDLQPIATNIADRAGAKTRFVVVGKPDRPTQRTGNDTTLVAFSLPHEPGTLAGALQDFALRGVDLSRIASRPGPEGYGTYLFYADVVGHIDDRPVAEALRALWLRAKTVHFLGSWPSAGGRKRDKQMDLERVEQATHWVTAVQKGQRL